MASPSPQNKPAWDDSTVLVVEEKKHVFRPKPLQAKSKSLRRPALKRASSRADSVGNSDWTLNSSNFAAVQDKNRFNSRTLKFASPTR